MSNEDTIKNKNLSKADKRKVLYRLGIGLVVILILMQFVRFVIPAFAISNPEVTHTVQWDSPRTQELWDTACADCHSNETVWPWYSYIAPVTFLITHDTNEGRDMMNISENHQIELDEMTEVIREGEMPPKIYTVIHSDADLNDTEKQELIAGLQATFGTSGQSSDQPTDNHENDEREGDDHDDDD